MEESSGTKPKELEQEHHTVPNGRCTTHGHMENAMAKDESAGTKVEVYISVGAKIVPSAEDSIKLLPLGELPQDTNLCSSSPVKVQDENHTGILSSSKQVTPDHNYKLGSDIVADEAKENHVIATENTDNEPIKDQNSEFEHISMEQEGTPPEKVTQNDSLESSTSKIDIQSRIYTGDLFGPPTDNASKKIGLEQLGPGQETGTEGPSNSEDAVKGTPVLPGNGQISLTSLECSDSVKVLTEKRKKNKQLPVNSSRSLRSRSQEKSKVPDTTNIVMEESADKEKKKKKRKKLLEKNKGDEFSRIRKHLRYLLQRIQYEKSFIDAYSGEGWKGQSLEKLKPEKELQRAKTEILRRKLKIRDVFQRLDSLCTEGRIPETLFDSEGEIDSEDIFCAKCGSKDVTLSNDIILCDGACERGFHQFCLDPPLLIEHIPPGDEGWLCPGCDCKVDCLELLNDSQGTNISVSDSWEKVFAVEAAAAAAGKNLDDLSGLPSDDSEDDDYDPDDPNLNEKVQVGVSSSDDSDNHSASDDQRVLPQKELLLGLPSDDSEDDDYDPDGLNIDLKSKVESSSSDFTSDSEDLTVVFDKCKPSGEVQGPVTLSPDRVRSDEEDGHLEEGDPASMYPRRQLKRLDYKKLHDEEYGNTSSDSSDDDYMDLASPNKKRNSSDEDDSLSPNLEHLTTEHGKETGDPEEGDFASIYPKRQVKRLDYKKLHDEEYGNTSSDSSDEDYRELASPNTEKNNSDKKDSFSPNPTTEHEKETDDLELDHKMRETAQIKGGIKKKLHFNGTNSTSSKSCRSSTTARGRSSSRLKKESDISGTESTPARLQKDSSPTGGKSTSRTSSFGEHATQRLLQSFKENQYPQRAVKESLASEVGLSVQQVSKWFENARHSFRHSPHKISDAAKITPDKGTPLQKSMNLSESNSKLVLDNATCSEVKKKKQDKGMAALTECFDKDITSKMVADEEGSRQNSRITRARKRKAEFISEATEPNTSVETPKQNVEVTPPKTQGVRKSSRIQSKS
ncbi:pathogenesis-related homeodomain protein isoform X2 [Apium graveolens]